MKHSDCALAISVAVLLGCVRVPGGEPSPTGSSASALTAEQCAAFQVNGTTQICHHTSSARNPYVIVRTSERACVSGHTPHLGDYITSTDPASPLYDPNCHGGGCLPEGAPCDATLGCCGGLACVSGTCACLGSTVFCEGAGACVDLSTDPNNCGRCGNACQGACTNGSCGASACDAAGLSTFADNFNRAAGPLGGTYLGSIPLDHATISANQACGDDHAGAVVQISTPTNAVTIDYDFVGPTLSNLETVAVAANFCASDFVYAGLDSGGSLQVGDFLGFKARSARITFSVNTAYHLRATFSMTGTVSVVVTAGSATVGSLTASLGRTPAYHQAGFVVGRDLDGLLTCVDDLAIHVN